MPDPPLPFTELPPPPPPPPVFAVPSTAKIKLAPHVPPAPPPPGPPAPP